MAGETDLFFRHRQTDCSHVAVGNHLMADRAPHRHRRMHYPAAGLVPMTGGALGVREESVLLDRLRLRSPRQYEQEETEDRLLSAPHLTKRRRAA